MATGTLSFLVIQKIKLLHVVLLFNIHGTQHAYVGAGLDQDLPLSFDIPEQSW